MSPYAEAMLISELWRHREWDRSVPYSPAAPGGTSKTAAQIAELAAQIAAGGITEPLLIHYDPWIRRALLGEGNHRIWLAREAGQETAPVIATYIAGYLDNRRGGYVVPGEPRLQPQMPHGYLPSVFRPSLVFPPEYFPGPTRWLVPLLDYEPGLVSSLALA